MLHNISQERLQQDSYKARYLALRDRRPGHQEDDSGSREPWLLSLRRYLPRHWRFSSTKRADALLQSGAILDAGLTPGYDTRSTRVDPGLGAASDEEKQSRKLLRNEELHFISEQRVSWLTFLRHLFKIESLASTSKVPRLSRANKKNPIRSSPSV